MQNLFPWIVDLVRFTADPAAALALADSERLTFGHMVNLAFATEISQIDPLPHQRGVQVKAIESNE